MPRETTSRTPVLVFLYGGGWHWGDKASLRKGFGLVRGWNRVTVFMGWQVAATLLAMACLAMVRWLPVGSGLRRLSMVPAWTIALPGVYSNMSSPPPNAPRRAGGLVTGSGGVRLML